MKLAVALIAVTLLLVEARSHSSIGSGTKRRKLTQIAADITFPDTGAKGDRRYAGTVSTQDAGEAKDEETGLWNAASKAFGGENESKDNGAITMTYGRVVLEGSKIRLSCPHSITMAPEASFATVQRSSGSSANSYSNRQKQFAFVEQQSAHPNLDQVKWFRNHVPLLNLNHFQTDQAERPALPRTPSPDLPSEALALTTINITELSRTAAKLYHPSTNATKDVAKTEQWQTENLLKESSLTKDESEAAAEGEASLASENFNELVDGAREATNIQAESGRKHEFTDETNSRPGATSATGLAPLEWHINEFGELVINKVSQYFAGKYTCLVAGKQSEVLLDVLVDKLGTDKKRPEQAFKLVESVQEAEGKDVKVPRRNADFSPLNPDELRAGSVPIDDGSSSLGASIEGAQPAASVLRYKLPERHLAPTKSSFDEANFIRGREGSVTEESKSSETKSSTDDAISFVISDQTLSNAAKQAHLEGLNDEEKKDVEMSSKINYYKRFHPQRHPIHMVKNEAILTRDLKFIPGFLYTKHQLYCPITSEGMLQWDYYYPLIQGLCPKTVRSNSEVREELQCYKMAELFIVRLATICSDSDEHDDCPESIWDLVWFKDAERLEFASNGRVTDTNLNIKLIDFPSPVQKTKTSQISAEDWTTQVAADKEVQPSPANMSSKWIWPPKGRTLEIDGVRKESAGRYTCALKLSITKLRKIIQSLRKNNDSAWPAKWNGNDISCCDDLRSLSKSLDQRKHQHSQSVQIASIEAKTEMLPETISHNLSVSSGPSGQSDGPSDLLADGDSLTKRFALFESIVKGTASKEQSLNYIEQLLLQLQSPLTTIQTFSLVISERPANSCALWSDIVGASDAYTRRKLADFKRLKRSLERRRDLATTNTESQNVYTFIGDKSPPASSLYDESSIARRTFIDSQRDAVYMEPTRSSNSVGNDETTELNDVSSGMANGELYYDEHDSTGMGLTKATRDLNSANENLNAAGGIEEIDSQQGDTNGSNDRDLVLDNNDNGLTVMATSSQASGNHLPTNNGKKLSLDQVNTRTLIWQQTKSPRAHVASFNYANERNLSPYYGLSGVPSGNSLESVSVAGREASDAGSNANIRVLARDKRSQSLIKPENYDLSLGTKKLITQREMNRVNIVQKGFETSLSANTRQRTHPRAYTHAVINEIGANETSAPAINYNFDGGDAQGPKLKLATLGFAKARFVRATNDDEANQADIFSANSGKIEAEIRNPTLKDDLQSFNIGHYPTYGQARPTTSDRFSIDTSSFNAQRKQQTPMGYNFSPPEKQRKITERITIINDSQPSSDISSEFETKPFTPTQMPALASMEPLAREETINESLMWSAGQYLYMHMKAVASSSLFGLEVGVEWSNERTNGTDINLRSGSPSDGPGDTVDLNNLYVRHHSAAPFATIDVISGQNLLLQCTAHALGRLPDVKWYKRISSIPLKLKHLVNMVRRIENDLYWPLNELHFLDDSDQLARTKDFVCSQTTTIFDNLENQTFTIVNSLQLSQYNDAVRLEAVDSNSLSMSNFNLYACIVDADVRHNYATLGVHLRETPGNIALEISKRLNARSILSKSEPVIKRPSQTSQTTSSSKTYSDFDLFRESRLIFPLKSSWIPIQNGSNFGYDKLEEFPIAPATLIAIIAIVLSSLVALLYLTARSYRSLTLLHLEDSIDNHVPESTDHSKSSEEIETPDRDVGLVGQSYNLLLPPEVDLMHMKCSCQFEANIEQMSSPLDNLLPTDGGDICNQNSFIFEHSGPRKPELITSDGRYEQPLYAAHSHNIDPHFICHTGVGSPYTAQLPSNENSRFTYDHRDENQQTMPTCCASSISSMVCAPNKRSRVNMIENPLVSVEQDQSIIFDKQLSGGI